jgi:hypothetical protein
VQGEPTRDDGTAERDDRRGEVVRLDHRQGRGVAPRRQLGSYVAPLAKIPVQELRCSSKI